MAKKSIQTSGQNGKIETPLSEVKVCGCCLGSSSSDSNEIVECDGCGISVHEVSKRVDIGNTLCWSFRSLITCREFYFINFSTPLNRAVMEYQRAGLLHQL